MRRKCSSHWRKKKAREKKKPTFLSPQVVSTHSPPFSLVWWIHLRKKTLEQSCVPARKVILLSFPPFRFQANSPSPRARWPQVFWSILFFLFFFARIGIRRKRCTGPGSAGGKVRDARSWLSRAGCRSNFSWPPDRRPSRTSRQVACVFF